MSIKAMFEKKMVLSFEVFPPKPDTPICAIEKTLAGFTSIPPDYISVTYGAGGGNTANTVEVAKMVPKYCDCPALGHMTCVGATKERVDEVLREFKQAGVKHLLALRGDIPKGADPANAFLDFRYASDLVSHIKKNTSFSVAASCYPEGHFESPSLKSDLEHLKYKVDQGVDWLVSQLFFDNDAFYSFLDHARRAGITIPIAAGIMPVINASQILRMTTLCGASIPAKLSKLFAKYGEEEEDFRKAGMDFCCSQIMDLVEAGIDGLHLYTMNRPKTTIEILARTKLRGHK